MKNAESTTRSPKAGDAVLVAVRPSGDFVTGTIVGRAQMTGQPFVVQDDLDGWTCYLYEASELQMLDPEFDELQVAWQVA